MPLIKLGLGKHLKVRVGEVSLLNATALGLALDMPTSFAP